MIRIKILTASENSTAVSQDGLSGRGYLKVWKYKARGGV